MVATGRWGYGGEHCWSKMPEAFPWETLKDWFEYTLQITHRGKHKMLQQRTPIHYLIKLMHRGCEFTDASHLEVKFPRLFWLGWEDPDGSGVTLAEWNQSHIWQPQRELLQKLSHRCILRETMTSSHQPLFTCIWKSPTQRRATSYKIQFSPYQPGVKLHLRKFWDSTRDIGIESSLSETHSIYLYVSPFYLFIYLFLKALHHHWSSDAFWLSIWWAKWNSHATLQSLPVESS